MDIINLGIQVDSKGVATATKRLDELPGAAAKAESSVSSLISKFGGLTASLVSVGAATANFMSVAAEAKELRAMSDAIGVSTQSLQQFQAAAGRVNISAEQTGDILKDVADRLGDLAITGGGEALDLFERLNLDIKDFQNLAPDEALIRIGKAMDDARLGQNDRVFLLESLANDLSKLDPLLRNNAESLKQFGTQAQSAGAVLTDFEISKLMAANAQFAEVKTELKGVGNQAAIAGAHIVSAFDIGGSLSGVTEALREMNAGLHSISESGAAFDVLTVAAGAFVARGLGPVIASTATATAKTIEHQAAVAISAAGYRKVEAAAAQAALTQAQAHAKVTAAALAEANAHKANLAEMAIYGPGRAAVERQISAAAAAHAASMSAVSAAEAKAAATMSATTLAARAQTVAMTASAAASRAAAGALALVGGPVGAAILAATAIYTFASNSDKAKRQAEELRGEVDKLAVSFREMGKEQLVVAQYDIKKDIAAAQEELRIANARVETLNMQARYAKDLTAYNEQYARAKAASADASKLLADREKLLSDVNSRLNDINNGVVKSEKAKASQFSQSSSEAMKQADALNEMIGALSKEYVMLGKSAVEQELYKFQLAGATEEQLKAIKTMLEAKEANKKYTDELKKNEKQLKKNDEAQEALRKEQEKQIGIINKLAKEYERSLNPDKDWDRVDALEGLTGEYRKQGEILYDQNKAIEEQIALDAELETYAEQESKRMDEKLQKQKQLNYLIEEASKGFGDAAIRGIESGSFSGFTGSISDFMMSEQGKNLSFENVFGNFSKVFGDGAASFGGSVDKFIKGIGGMQAAGSYLGGAAKLLSGTSAGAWQGGAQIAGTALGTFLGGPAGAAIGGKIASSIVGALGIGDKTISLDKYYLSGQLDDYNMGLVRSRDKTGGGKKTFDNVYNFETGQFGSREWTENYNEIGQGIVEFLDQFDKDIENLAFSFGEILGKDIRDDFEASFDKSINIEGKDDFEKELAKWIDDKLSEAITTAANLATEGENNPFNTALREMVGNAETPQEALATASQMMQLNTVLSQMGVNADNLGIEFIDASGGLEKASQSASAYYSLFADHQEIAKNEFLDMSEKLTQGLNEIGIQMPKNAEEFRSLVNESVALGDAGAETAAKLMKLAPSLYAVQKGYDLFIDQKQKAQDDFFDMSSTVRAGFEEIGRPVPKNAEEFRILADELLSLGDEGNAAYIKLMELAPSLYAVQSAAQTAKNTLDELSGIAIVPDKRLKSEWDKLDKDLKEIGLESLPRTRDGLSDYLELLDESNESDYEKIQLLKENKTLIDSYYSSLEKAEPAWNGVYDVVEKTTKTINEAADALEGFRKYLGETYLNVQTDAEKNADAISALGVNSEQAAKFLYDLGDAGISDFAKSLGLTDEKFRELATGALAELAEREKEAAEATQRFSEWVSAVGVSFLDAQSEIENYADAVSEMGLNSKTAAEYISGLSESELQGLAAALGMTSDELQELSVDVLGELLSRETEAAAATLKLSEWMKGLGESFLDVKTDAENYADTLDSMGLNSATASEHMRSLSEDSITGLARSLGLTNDEFMKLASGGIAELARREEEAAKNLEKLNDELEATSDNLKSLIDELAQRSLNALQSAIDNEKAILDKQYSDKKNALELSHEAEIAQIEESRAAHENALKSFQDIASILDRAISSTVIQSEAMERARHTSAQRQLAAMAASGQIDPGALESAVGGLSGDSMKFFGTFQDYARDTARTAGALGELNAINDSQMSVEEQSLAALDNMQAIAESQFSAEMQALDAQHLAQMTALDNLYLNAESQLNAAKNIDSKAYTIDEALQLVKETEALMLENDTLYQEQSIAALNQQIIEQQATRAAIVSTISSLSAMAAAAQTAPDEISMIGGPGVIPGFASGGQHEGGLRIVGENGPELEYTPPSHITSSNKTSELLSYDELLAELKALRNDIKQGNFAIAKNTGKTSRIIERWEGDGIPETRTA